jgi:hypothetical protein
MRKSFPLPRIGVMSLKIIPSSENPERLGRRRAIYRSNRQAWRRDANGSSKNVNGAIAKRGFDANLLAMKRIVALIGVAAVILASQVRAVDQAGTPEDCIRNFYHWYVTNLVANHGPIETTERDQALCHRSFAERDRQDGQGSGRP